MGALGWMCAGQRHLDTCQNDRFWICALDGIPPCAHMGIRKLHVPRGTLWEALSRCTRAQLVKGTTMDVMQPMHLPKALVMNIYAIGILAMDLDATSALVECNGCTCKHMVTGQN